MSGKSYSISRLPGFNTVAILVFIALYLPIMVLVVYSFNAGRSISDWQGFSLSWYSVAWDNAEVKDATLRSLGLAPLPPLSYRPPSPPPQPSARRAAKGSMA